MRTFLIFVACCAIIFSAAFAVGRIHAMSAAHDAHIAKAAYDHGKAIGTTLGMCSAFEDTLKSPVHPPWFGTEAAKSTLDACTNFERLHAPGTIETVTL